MAPVLHLLAHSHAVSFLDAATDWRSRVRLAGPADGRFGAAFQGWFAGGLPASPVDLSLVRAGSPLATVSAWIMPPNGAVGPLVEVQRRPGAPPEVRVNPGYEAVLDAWRGKGPVLSMIRGNEHALSMLARFPAYDFLDPEVPGLLAGVPLLDEGIVDEYAGQWAELVVHPLEVARRRLPDAILHVLPPPPREHPERSPHGEELGEEIRRHGFCPAPLRLKWYRRYCRQVAGRLAPLGCDVLRAPAAALTPDGMLKDELAEGLTHGNAAYGALVAAQVEAWLAGLAP